MTTDPLAPPDGTASTDPQLQLQSVYLKDCSFEAPNGPRVTGDWNPQVSLDLQTTSNVLGTDMREIVLTVTVGARQAEANVFLVEVQQAGVFFMKNLSEDDARRAIGSVCPNVLFPYARAAVSSLVTQGGFPQFLLPPVNFDALYARSLADGQNVTRQ
jgi:preprotein translocase subunit SecB